MDSWRIAYAGIVASEFLASLSYERREKMWRDLLLSPASQSFIYVAETAVGQVVGFACAGPERGGDDIYKGEIYGLYLLPGYQRQGIGSLLFRVSAQELNRCGMTSLLIWVLAANPARKFYEALGGKYLRGEDIEIGKQQLVKVAYGWKDVGTIAGYDDQD